jgi:hypothetical protein
MYYEELKQLLNSKSYLPGYLDEDNKDIDIENKLLRNLMSVNQQRELFQQEKIELMISVIEKQRDLIAVIDMLSRMDLSVNEEFFRQQIQLLLMKVKNPTRSLRRTRSTISSRMNSSLRRLRDTVASSRQEDDDSLSLSPEDVLRMFRSTRIPDDPSKNFPLSVMEVTDTSDGQVLLNVSDYKIMYVKHLLQG